MVASWASAFANQRRTQFVHSLERLMATALMAAGSALLNWLVLTIGSLGTTSGAGGLKGGRPPPRLMLIFLGVSIKNRQKLTKLLS